MTTPEHFMKPEEIRALSHEYAGEQGWDPEALAVILDIAMNLSGATTLARACQELAELVTHPPFTTDQIRDQIMVWNDRVVEHVENASIPAAVNAMQAYVRAETPGTGETP